MGAPTSNRKRGGHVFSLRYLSSPSPSLESDSPVDHHVSKKPKLSPMHLNPKPPISPFSSQSTFSRVQQYPKPTKPISREVHGPCRRPTPKFSHPMGNTMFRNLEEAKNAAFDTFRYVRKDKEVIDVGEGCSKDVIIDDLSDEEVEILDDRHDGGESVGLTQKSNVDVFYKEKYQNFAHNQIQGSSSVVSDLSNDGGHKSGFLSANRRQGSSSVVSDLSNQTPKASYYAGKLLSYLSLSREVEDVHEPPHKKLYEAAESRNHKLSHLSYLIEVTAKKLPKIPFLGRSAKTPEKDLAREPFVDLTNDEEAEVSRALSNSNRRKVLVTHPDSNIEITGEVLQCLRPGAWLNDEVINLYLELLREREKREPKKFLKCHFFNTFFYKKLISGKGGYDFKAVKRWTTKRKIGYGLIECDKIFVPIHKEIHWCLAIINKKDEKFQYLDSLKGRDSKVLQVLAKYYADEVKDKSEKDIDVSSWKLEYVNDLPAQENGFDCGMFMIKYADFYSRGLGLCFNQDNMPYFRKRTAKEILRLKAD